MDVSPMDGRRPLRNLAPCHVHARGRSIRCDYCGCGQDLPPGRRPCDLKPYFAAVAEFMEAHRGCGPRPVAPEAA